MTEPLEDEEAELAPEIERALERALRSAWEPRDIDPERHERILELALEDPLAPPSAEEVTQSERLREALEGRAEHDHLELVQALSAAARSAEAPAPRVDVTQALGAKPAARGRLIYVAFGATTAVLAAAAAFALVVGTMTRSEAPVAASVQQPAPLSTSRSSAPLFQDRFTTEETTSRIDRITSVRERELRQNRYVAWGVR
jgi:hypothetical protein